MLSDETIYLTVSPVCKLSNSSNSFGVQMNITHAGEIFCLPIKNKHDSNSIPEIAFSAQLDMLRIHHITT